jgi:hypothetical protein
MEVGRELMKERGRRWHSLLVWWCSEAVERRRWRCGGAMRTGEGQVTFIVVRGRTGGQKSGGRHLELSSLKGGLMAELKVLKTGIKKRGNGGEVRQCSI